MIADADMDGSGTINFEEFISIMQTKMGERDSREEMIKAFRLFDDDETGNDLCLYIYSLGVISNLIVHLFFPFM